MTETVTKNPAAQHYVECEFCESRPAQHFCNTCHGPLCDICKQDHTRKKIFQNHKISPLSLARQQTYFCHDHKESDCLYHCSSCQKPVCSECITGKHKGHVFDKLSSFVQEQKQTLFEEIKNIETNLIPAYERNLSDIKARLSDVCQSTDLTKVDIHKETENIIQAVKSVESQYLVTVERNKKKAVLAMESEQSLVQNRLESLHTIKDNLQKLYNTNLLDEETYKNDIAQIQEMKTLPDKIFCTLSKYFPRKINYENIANHFGELNPFDITAVKGEDVYSSANRDDITQSNKKLMATVQTTRHFNVGTHLNFLLDVVCLNSDRALITGDNNKIRIVDLSGKIKGKISVILNEDDFPKGISVTKEDTIIYTDKPNRKVMSVSLNGKVDTLFTIKDDYFPIGPCATFSGDIFICLIHKFDPIDEKQIGKVVKFTKTGDILMEIEEDRGKRVFKCPVRIAENPVTHDIVVSDRGKYKIVVVDNKGRLKFEYAGKPAIQTYDFYCRQVTCDDLGHILTADFKNETIHILSKDGELLKLLTKQEGVCTPWGICFDGNDTIWVTEWERKNVKLFKYLH